MTLLGEAKMKKKLNEANDSWDSMFPVNINKRSLPKLDLQSLYSEEEMFRIFDITMPKTLEVLGNMLMSGLIEHYNPVSPINTLHQVRMQFNRAGYDFPITPDRVSALSSMSEGHVDFPLSAGTSGLYNYTIDQTFPGYRVEDDGIEKKLGYKLVVRIHVEAVTDSAGTLVKVLNGEILPQDV